MNQTKINDFLFIAHFVPSLTPQLRCFLFSNFLTPNQDYIFEIVIIIIITIIIITIMMFFLLRNSSTTIERVISSDAERCCFFKRDYKKYWLPLKSYRPIRRISQQNNKRQKKQQQNILCKNQAERQRTVRQSSG